MSDSNQQEFERMQKLRQGSFSLSTHNAGTNRCGRCRLEKPHIWVLSYHPKLSFGEINLSAPQLAPTYENVCRDCLGDSEVAELLRPVVMYWLKATLRSLPFEDLKALDHIAAVYGWLGLQNPAPPLKDYREVGLRALEGLKGVPPPEIDWESMFSELESALARDMFIAAHPDRLPETVEEIGNFKTQVAMFFRDGLSTERHALRSAIGECVLIFRRFFYRRVV